MSAAAAAAPVRVVLIDDTPDLRELLGLALVREGMVVVGEAGDGRTGIQVVRETFPDLVLLDLSMPVMDGLEALPEIRKLLPEGRIVVLSGFGATQMAERALTLGADGYLQKGQSLGRLVEHLRTVTGPVAPPAPPELVAVPPAAPDDLAQHALDLAPYGVLEIADENDLPLLHANPQALRLLGEHAAPGTPLVAVDRRLATLVAYHRLDPDAAFPVEIGGSALQATLRRSGSSLLVYLDGSAADLALLRRAIATTAHEIRGPVTVLTGIAETVTLHRDDMPAEQHARLMGAIARQARMLDAITADLLTAAQIQRGSLRITTQDIDVAALVESIVTDRYDVEVVRLDRRAVRGDPMRLEQMLSNLVGNAHKYGRAPYVVTVRPHEERADLVCVDVADHGDGVPAEFREHLFREFSRAPGTTATGTGLGLYVVRTLAQAQGGSASYAAGPGGGAVFTLCLPAASSPT